MGTATNQTALTPFFEFRDQTDGSNVVNGFNRQDTAGPNFLISYASPNWRPVVPHYLGFGLGRNRL